MVKKMDGVVCKMKKILFIFLTGAVLIHAQTYYAYFPYETDTVLTAWLIRKYKDPEAKFIPVKRGTSPAVSAECQINTSVSPYRRSARFTAFQTAVKKVGATGECIRRLERISRIVEMAPWRKQEFPEASTLQLKIHEALKDGHTAGSMEAAFPVIEKFCASIKGEP